MGTQANTTWLDNRKEYEDKELKHRFTMNPAGGENTI